MSNDNQTTGRGLAPHFPKPNASKMPDWRARNVERLPDVAPTEPPPPSEAERADASDCPRCAWYEAQHAAYHAFAPCLADALSDLFREPIVFEDDFGVSGDAELPDIAFVRGCDVLRDDAPLVFVFLLLPGVEWTARAIAEIAEAERMSINALAALTLPVRLPADNEYLRGRRVVAVYERAKFPHAGR